MSAKSVVANIGTIVLGIIAFLAIAAAIGVFLAGAEWAGKKILPWLMVSCVFVFGFNVIVIAPLAIFQRTRPWAGFGFFISSYVFGLTGWFMGLLLTWALWGTLAVVIGIFILGVGVVPIAMLATIFKGMWLEFGLLTLSAVLTFGLRGIGMHLTEA